MTTFMVMDQLSVYNVIIGRPTLNAFRAIPSTYHMHMKFPTTEGIGVVKGDQINTQQCYVVMVKNSGHPEQIMVVDLGLRKEARKRATSPKSKVMASHSVGGT